jgi:hypothetical protein
MLEFISKLQYKTYEKGEFSDENRRSLEETLQLIKDFPQGLPLQFKTNRLTA